MIVWEPAVKLVRATSLLALVVSAPVRFTSKVTLPRTSKEFAIVRISLSVSLPPSTLRLSWPASIVTAPAPKPPVVIAEVTPAATLGAEAQTSRVRPIITVPPVQLFPEALLERMIRLLAPSREATKVPEPVTSPAKVTSAMESVAGRKKTLPAGPRFVVPVTRRPSDVVPVPVT